MWRVKTVTKFKNSFFPVLIYWNDNRIHLNTFKKSVFVSMVPPLFKGAVKTRISLRSHNLVLMIKAGESDWVDLNSDQKFLDTPLVIKDGDSFPVGVKTVGDLKKTIVRF